MYARSTTVRGNPAAIEVGIAYVREAVIPAVRDMDGCIGLSMLADRADGRCIITTAWADAEAMRNSAENVRGIRDRTAEILVGPAEVEEWEIAILHRQHETRDHGCARVIWATGDPAQLDHMIETFRMSMLSRMEELPGFCSVSVMVDRASGTSATAVTYESREAMDAAREQAVVLRKEFTDAMGMEVTDIAAFDLVLAHLRVPETV